MAMMDHPNIVRLYGKFMVYVQCPSPLLPPSPSLGSLSLSLSVLSFLV